MKTIKEWLEELPEPYRSKALKNLEVDTEVDSLYHALWGAFTWAISPEGQDYWWEVMLKYYSES